MTDDLGPVSKECVEGYIFADPPLELLLFRRPPSRGRYWVPVSGKVEPTDRDFRSALCRELEEETGLRVGSAELVDLDWRVPFRADNGEVWRLHAFAVQVPRSFRPRLSPEHEEAEWVPVEEAERRLHFEDNRAAVERVRRLRARDDLSH
ncbi:MAG TPA: NUDIX domain-containing protein [Thermoplasmata archaeon]|nr:NUDIX domain-containing protein [Thermoplasmata archaeon]